MDGRRRRCTTVEMSTCRQQGDADPDIFVRGCHPPILQLNQDGAFNLLLPPNEVNFNDVRRRGEGQANAINCDRTALVATHDIQRNSHKWKERRS